MTNRPLARDIVSITFLVLCIGGLIAMNFWILRPFLLALICATIFVVATWPIMSRIQQWLGDKRSLAVVILTLALLKSRDGSRGWKIYQLVREQVGGERTGG